jgi:pimeloyl-ACP methyl ester carboxylesterase
MQKEIEKLDSPPIIMGHSMGALLTQILAARGLGVAHILLTPAPPWGVFALRWSVIKCFIEGLTRWAFWRKPFRPSCARATYAMLHLIPEAERQSYCGRMVYESGWATAQIGFWAFDFTKGAYVDAAKVTKPMLVIGGGQDRITPAAVVRQVAAKYSPGAEYKEFADMAHLVISEPGWEEVAGYAHDWMKRKGF